MMKKPLATLLAVTALNVFASTPALAWEARTTSAGVAEQSALTSVLHRRLLAAGFARGLYEPLTIPPADAADLMTALALLPPTEGATPDARGTQSGLAWLAAGAMLADVNVADAANHFFEPSSGRGFSAPNLGTIAGLSRRVRELLGRTPLPARGMPAPDWVVSPENPLGMQAFVDQYARAIRAATPGERSRHMAAALVAAGSMIHVLADMGSPSHVRNDARAHLDLVGSTDDDRGSRFERVAAIAYGRLGVPGRSRVVSRDTVRGFFTGGTGAEPGLADLTASRFFSAYTLPSEFELRNGTVSSHLAFPLPALPDRLSAMAASQEQGATLLGENGVCLARYHAVRGHVTFSLDDECILSQVSASLPEAVSFTTGFVDFLFRGSLTVSITDGRVQVGGASGAVELFAEDSRGVRSKMGATIPSGTISVVALSVGVDANGESLVAFGAAQVP